jgi:hypothetical protein
MRGHPDKGRQAAEPLEGGRRPVAGWGAGQLPPHSLYALVQLIQVLVLHNGRYQFGVLFQHLQSPGNASSRGRQGRWQRSDGGGSGSGGTWRCAQGVPIPARPAGHTCCISTVVSIGFGCAAAAEGCPDMTERCWRPDAVRYLSSNVPDVLRNRWVAGIGSGALTISSLVAFCAAGKQGLACSLRLVLRPAAYAIG